MARSAAVVALFLLIALSSLDQGPTRSKVQAEETGVTEENASPPKIEEPIGGAIPDALSTDSQVVERESESVGQKTLRAHAQKFTFQAEVSRLMDIIVNSLYSNKDIFLRELISNASDALDKIRFLSLTDKSQLGEGDDAKLDIRIKLDKEKKLLSIRDRGIGMTKDELIKNLGTIAKSGTSAFFEKIQSGGDLNLIGQFGVGFYSVYLVADYVEVISKNNEDKQYIWESKADGSFAVSEDEENEPLGRGTEIKLHLKDDAADYLEESRLKDLVQKYSEFMSFPIYLWNSTEIEVEVPIDEESEETVEEEEDKPAEDKTAEETETEEEPEKPKTKKVKEIKWDWELLNDVKAIWLRSPKDVTEDEYSKFYHSLSKDYNPDKPMSWSHFSAEGDVEFKAVLFIPPKAPHDLYENYYNSKASLKLYVRRVFISDEFDELLPKYLNFLKGLVDSDTLPLNVSREMLQQHSSLRTIKKKLVRKALEMIRSIVNADPDEGNKSESKSEDSKDENADEKKEKTDEKKEENKGKYVKFWNEYGKSIKLGIVEDANNRERLAKLLRFYSSKSDDKLSSLEQYVSRMKPEQKDIYFITGQDREQLKKSPFLERLQKEGYEVIFFTDPVDEYLTQYLTEFDDKKFINISKEGLKLGQKDKEKAKVLKESFKPLLAWWKDVLKADGVDKVKISNRLADTPAVVVTSAYGWSANMERIMRAQTLTDNSRQGYMRGKRVLEINPRHPIIKELRGKVAELPEDESTKATGKLIYKTALMDSGFLVDDSKEFASQIYSIIKSNLNVSPDAEFDEEIETVIEDKESVEENEDGEGGSESSEPDSPFGEDGLPRGQSVGSTLRSENFDPDYDDDEKDEKDEL